MNTTLPAKEFAQKTLDEMPDDVSVEEIIKELAFKCTVERGLQDSLNDRVILRWFPSSSLGTPVQKALAFCASGS